MDGPSFFITFPIFFHHFPHPQAFICPHRRMRSVEAQGAQTPQSSTAGAEDPHLDGDFVRFSWWFHGKYNQTDHENLHEITRKSTCSWGYGAFKHMELSW